MEFWEIKTMISLGAIVFGVAFCGIMVAVFAYLDVQFEKDWKEISKNFKLFEEVIDGY